MLRASTSLIARHPGSFLSSAAAQHLASGARALRGVQQEQQQQPHSLLYGACRRLACSAAVLGTRQAAAAAGAAGSVQQGSSITQHMATASTWAGTGSQHDFMAKDECLVVDENDIITGTSNKHACHRFEPHQPKGQLHRAFSVFLFDDQGRLLLQQRAKDKITFPSVWTNTCCSHPLAGQTPDEVDQPQQVQDGTVPGIRNAAVRKLQHELGIAPSQVPLSSFRFLTRLHYCASDSDTWGPNAEWGEHEVDYILFIRANVTLQPNPEEVDDVRYVTKQELADMMSPGSGLRWSPWFKIIAERFLPTWWDDLEGALTTDKHADRSTIHHILG